MKQKRFIFTITTRDGVSVTNLRVLATDYETAEKKIKNMYRYCRIDKHHQEQSNTRETYHYEDVIDLVTKEGG
jgi:ribosomal protein L15E